MFLREYIQLFSEQPPKEGDAAVMDRLLSELAWRFDYQDGVPLESQPGNVYYFLLQQEYGSGILWDLVKPRLRQENEFSIGYYDYDALVWFLQSVLEHPRRYSRDQIMEIFSRAWLSVVCLVAEGAEYDRSTEEQKRYIAKYEAGELADLGVRREQFEMALPFMREHVREAEGVPIAELMKQYIDNCPDNDKGMFSKLSSCGFLSFCELVNALHRFAASRWGTERGLDIMP